MKTKLGVILIFCNFFLFVSKISFAYSDNNKVNIMGEVCDSLLNPVSYCNVILQQYDDVNITYGVITDEKGEFTLDLPKQKYILTISCIGYGEFADTLSIYTNLNVGRLIIDEKILELGEVVVRNQIFRRNTDGYLFSPGNSEIVKGINTSKLLDQLPGVWLNKANKSVSINGKKNTMVMIDGRLMKMSNDELYTYLESINAENIKSIEVISDPGAKYDANFTGGIIKITLKKNINTGFSGALGMEYQFTEDDPMTPLNTNLFLDYGKEKLSLYSNFSYNENNFRQTLQENTLFYGSDDKSLFNDYVGKNNTKNYLAKIGSVYRFTDKHLLGLDFEFAHVNGRGTNQTNSLLRKNEIDSYSNSYSNRNGKNSRYNVSLNYKYTIDEAGSNIFVIADYMRFDATANQYDSLRNFESLPSLYDDVLNFSDRGTDYYTLSVDFAKIFNSKHQLESGVKIVNTNMDTKLDYNYLLGNSWIKDDEFSDHYLYRESIFAAYANFKSQIKRFNFNVGLRVEHTYLNPFSYVKENENIRKNYTDLFPSLSIMYVLNSNKNNFLNFNYNRSIRRPGFAELNPYRIPLNKYTYVIGNPQLKPSYTNSLSLNLIIRNSYTFSLGFTNTDGVINQLIIEDKDNLDILFYQYANMDRVNSYYAAISLPVKFFKFWNSSIDLVYMYNMNRNDKYKFDGHMFQGRMNNYFSLPKNWEMALNYLINTGGTFGIWKMEAYGSLDLSVNKSLLDGKIIASAGVTNLLDDGGSIYKMRSDQPGFINKTSAQRMSNMVRTYSLSLKYNFKIGKDFSTYKVKQGNKDERAR